MNYRRFGDYLGIGAGAHGKFTAGSTRPGVARSWAADVSRAAIWPALGAGAGPGASVEAELPFEYLMNALRLPRGLRRREFEAATGLWPGAAAAAAGPLAGARLLEQEGRTLAREPSRVRFLNDVITEFLPAQPYFATKVAEKD